MRILVIDAQGGGLGREIIKSIIAKFGDNLDLIGVGTNSMATSAMLKAGVKKAATGENAVVVNSQTADIIMGPIGILMANSLYGEITTRMVEAVGSSRAKRILIPFLHDDNIIVGVEDYSIKKLVDLAVDQLGKFIGEE